MSKELVTAIKNHRLIEVTEKLTMAIKDVVNECEIKEEELLKAISFLNEVGKKGEFHLLSDVLGVSVLVDNITYQDDADADTTLFNVEGPLYREEAPIQQSPGSLCELDEPGDVLFMQGKVISAATGNPIPNALLDVWQANAIGDYENEDENQTDYNLRARILADHNGYYEFRTVVPAGYDIGKGGPVGELMKAVGRHAMRPAHIHFKIEGESFKTLTTQLFPPNVPWLDSDAIGAVKEPLIMKLEKVTDPVECKKRGVTTPFYICQYDFRLKEKV
ncbi:dioxygenase family protein [Neobacillus kokaensis]|uniref:6-chlorohydroxyquinol-1,2-dioxygenase n=1 Tax=Neobacillus kokaensis TaxID=2759023 RepID=A0ABQ3N746_9BACI|nr:dioxygenase [Neobacillus kokaensis]GHH99808.1 6-chlorohydroxyquinol-1,2-dioxygenase [Neobacillus kokaensis]